MEDPFNTPIQFNIHYELERKQHDYPDDNLKNYLKLGSEEYGLAPILRMLCAEFLEKSELSSLSSDRVDAYLRKMLLEDVRFEEALERYIVFIDEMRFIEGLNDL